uniref:Si:ch73-379j16.2 n=1 Tax=Hucho hucho TaxID=62062 RepID=A0A4W5RKU7_9TELE
MGDGGQRRRWEYWWVALCFSLLLAFGEHVSAQIRYSIPEELKEGSVVGNVAKDLSLAVGTLEERRFRIVSGSNDALFQVNQNNGVLYVHKNIDREELCDGNSACMINLKIVVENPLEIHYIGVEISDVNDHSPSFSEKEQNLEIAESTLPGTGFQLQAARDPDSGMNSVHLYKLSHNEYFDLELRDTGEEGKIPVLKLHKPLDRELESKHILVLTAIDGGIPPRSGHVNISVTVLDNNDNRPIFNQNLYSVTIQENCAVGTIVAKVNATDLDDGVYSEIIYSFVKNLKRKVYDTFSLDSNTGEISVKGNIDFEDTEVYRADVMASDKGQPPMRTECRVIIKIKDVNDNKPEIELTSLSNMVSEDSKPETVISLISVTDKDSGINGKVICSLSEDIPFELKPSFQDNLYSLVTKQRLDRELVSLYDITITATDCGQPPLYTFKTLSVQISDVNDNSPEFSQNPFELYLVENNGPGASIFSVSATDKDLNENAEISYHIVRGEGTQNAMASFLNINSDNGIISIKDSDEDKIPFLILQKSLDRENRINHSLVLTAIDGGNPPKSGSLNITVTVLDVNDNKPVFSQDTYSVTLQENSPIGTIVVKVNATDLDEGLNRVVEYSLAFDLFEIDDVTGEITVKGLIDFEEQSVYEIDMQASDKGPVTLTGHCSVVINVKDVNDNAPEMEVTSLSSQVPEDARPGTAVALISVFDMDSGENGLVICTISDNIPFELNPSFQKNMYSLITKSRLDKESEPMYTVTITSTDKGVPSLSSHKTVTVHISDVNDNSPVFSRSQYAFYVPENNAPHASVFSLSASDRDQDENARVFYSIWKSDGDAPIISYLNINSDDGNIYALKSFDFETLKTFQFQVVATDSGTPSLSSNVTINVFILDQNDNAPVILYPVSANGSAEGVEEIPRNVNAGHLVTKVRAYDADIGYNGWLLFSLQEVTDHSLFALDRYTGQIRTLRSFTETDEAEHKLVILVKDNGNVSLSATATVIINAVEPKEAFAASDVKSAVKDEEENSVTFYLIITLGSVSALFLISIIVLIVMQCSKAPDYSSKYLQDVNYDGTLCHSIQYRSGDKRYMLVGPRMSIGSTICTFMIVCLCMFVPNMLLLLE